mgnify:CR=1 FL=1
MNQISTVSTSSKIFLSAFFVFLTISTPAYSQEANPDGIMGPYFSLSTADYPHQSNDGHYMTISASDSILLGVEDFHMEISHNGLTLWWSGQSTGSNAKFKIWGSGNIKIDIMGNEIEIGGGPSYGDPLIEISHNNSDFYLSYVDLDITADFSLFDLTMGADSLGIIYDSSDESYVFSGAASVAFVCGAI